jgi:hypothetical protein
MHFRDGKISEMWYVPTDQAGVVLKRPARRPVGQMGRTPDGVGSFDPYRHIESQ